MIPHDNSDNISTFIIKLTVCVGHTGQRDLIAYICLADALDRNREAVIFRIQGQPVWRGGG